MPITVYNMLHTMLSRTLVGLHRLQCSCSGLGRWGGGLRRLWRTRAYSSTVRSNGDSRQESGVHNRSVMDDIYARIKYTGPMTVADYMREVLTHPTKGYYMKGDVFGQKGDFITAPEISQVFGELMAVWLVSEWIAAEHPQPCQLVELGPGRGTLMGDILRVFKQFPGTSDSFSVHLVEVSHAMRLTQQAHLKDSGLPVSWHDSVKDVPRGLPTYFVAHEFFDALPIHQFQLTKEGWREIFVDIEDSSEKALRFVLSPGPTVSATIYTQHLPQDGSVTRAEVSPLMMVTCEEMSQRIKADGGTALVVDYGENGLMDFTLRSFKGHAEHHVLVEPGSADITSDVDFSLLRLIAEREGIVAHGPMTQNAFLHKMGIRQRVDALLQSAPPARAAQAKDLVSAYEMLTSDEQMGKRFKMMAFTQPGHTPVPF